MTEQNTDVTTDRPTGEDTWGLPDHDTSNKLMQIERYMPLTDFPDYIMGFKATVYNLRTGNWIHPTNGQIQLRRDGKNTRRNVEQLLTDTFQDVPKEVRYPDNLLGLNSAVDKVNYLRLLKQARALEHRANKQSARILELEEQAKPIERLQYNHNLEIELKDAHIDKLAQELADLKTTIRSITKLS